MWRLTTFTEGTRVPEALNDGVQFGAEHGVLEIEQLPPEHFKALRGLGHVLGRFLRDVREAHLLPRLVENGAAYRFCSLSTHHFFSFSSVSALPRLARATSDAKNQRR